MEVRLYRVILPARKIDEAVRFYSQILEQPGRRVSPGRHYFVCGEVILACVDPRADTDDWDARANSDHVYFAVTDLERAYELVKAAAPQSLTPIATRPWGERSFYARDPTGNPICFVDDKTLFTGR